MVYKENKRLYNTSYFIIRVARATPDKSNRKLTTDRIAQLDAIGFDWKMKERKQVETSLETGGKQKATKLDQNN